MGRLLLYACCGLLAFLAALVWQAPARLLALAIPDTTTASLDDWQGSLWAGSVRVAAAPGLPLRLHWDLAPGNGGLLGGTAHLRGDGVGLDAAVHANPTTQRVRDGAGRLGALVANRLLNPYEIEVSGDLSAQGLAATLVDGWPTALEGTLRWPGGPVSWRLADARHSAALPPLEGRLAMDGDRPVLRVVEAGRDGRLLEVVLARNGWVTVRMTRRMAQLAGFPWQGDQPADAVVLEVQERLL